VVRDAIETIQDLHGLVQGTVGQIRRLDDSSQEIGAITGLIAEICERTRVLSLNAAIQAASAGAAGRGFSAVAEEMQRLVLRTADAARRIAVLVELQQSDTLGASGAMERATEGVAESARQAAAAEAALAEIQHATRALTDQVAGGLVRASRDAEVAARLASTLHRAEAEPAQGDRR